MNCRLRRVADCELATTSCTCIAALGRWVSRRIFKAPSRLSALQVFEDTKHLIQSAVDGYNVCIFACEAARLVAWPAV